MIPTKEIEDYIKAGKKIQAVKLVRDYTGYSLKDANDYVNNLERTMKNAFATPRDTVYHRSSIFAVDGMDGHDFEYFCADLLRKTGFSDVRVTPGSGDQGVDVLASKDGIKYAIQCKNYASALSNTPVQEVSAGKQFYGCHVGVVMTNSTFTPGAIQLANATNVLLWDRTKLSELIAQAGGLSNLGIYPEYDGFDNDELEDGSDWNYGDVETTNSKRPRVGMTVWSIICLVWSAICFLVFVGGLIASNQQLMMVGLGEGLFVLTLGIMFRALSKAEKGNPYVCLFGKSIKKTLFVFLCIVIAYVFIIASIGLMGGFSK